MKVLITALLTALAAVLSLGGCVFEPEPPGYETEVVPPLPPVVVLGDEPYYYHDGYHYYYHDNRWDYSRERRGPWRELPRSHWPRETHYRNGPHGEYRGGGPGGGFGGHEHR